MTAGPYAFAYLECDVPPGVTLAEWRAQGGADHPKPPAARDRGTAERAGPTPHPPPGS